LVGKVDYFGQQSRLLYFSKDNLLPHKTLPEAFLKGLSGNVSSAIPNPYRLALTA
jgi:hypothetical protein